MKLFQRNGWFWIDYVSAAGERVRKSLGTRDAAKAHRMALQAEVGKLDGDPLVGDDARVSRLIEEYLKRPRVLRPASRKRLELSLRTIARGLGECAVTAPDIRARVKAYQAERLKAGKSASSINHEVGALKQVLREMADTVRGMVNPLVDLRNVRKPGKRPRALTLDETRRLLAMMRGPEDRLKLGLFLYTGMRRAEGVNLMWSQVDLKRGLIRLEPHDSWLGPKNGEARRVPICSDLGRILKEAPRRGQYVLTRRNGEPYKENNALLNWFKRIYKRAGITDWSELGVHTLRHTACSRLAQLGVRAEVRAKIAGHRTLRMQDRYTHTEEQEAMKAGMLLRYA